MIFLRLLDGVTAIPECHHDHYNTRCHEGVDEAEVIN